MSTATLRLHYRALHYKIKSARLIKINWKAVYFLAGVCLVAMLILYIISINQLTRGIFFIKNHNREISELLIQNRALQADFEENNFLAATLNKAKSLSFEKTKEVRYVTILQNSLAEAK